jgi:hypothetical protein
MSVETVRREIAAKRTYAVQLETRANDADYVFTDPTHRDHLRDEAARLMAEADRQEALLSEPRPHHG